MGRKAKNGGGRSIRLQEKDIEKSLQKTRSTRHVEDDVPEVEKEVRAGSLEGMSFTEKIKHVRNVQNSGGLSNADDKKIGDASQADVENFEDEILFENPLPLSLASELVPIKKMKAGLIQTADGRFVRIMEIMPINFLLKSALDQEKTTMAFANFLRIAPANFQIKALTRKTDVTVFIDSLRKDYQTEKDPDCRRLIEDSAEFLAGAGAAESVSRRYFFIFEVPRHYTEDSSFDEIVEKSRRLCGQYASYFNQCGNKVEEKYDDTPTVLGMIFDMLNREKNASADFDRKFSEVYSFYEETYGGKSVDFIPKGEFVAPDVVDMRAPDYIKSDGTYYGYFYVKGDSLPTAAYTGWVSTLTSMGEGVDVDIYAELQNKDKQGERVRRNLLWKKHDMSGQSDTNKEYAENISSVQSGYYIQQNLASEDFYFVSFMITVSAGSLKGLRDKMDAIKDYLKSTRIEVGSMRYEMDRAWESTLPFAKLDRKVYKRARRNVLSEGLSSFYPFISSEICDPDGVMLGLNEMSGSLCMINPFDTSKYKNANLSILGCTGAGKSYTLQHIALGFRKKGIQVFIIAPDKGHEFKRSCDAVGGSFWRVSPGGKVRLNILEIRPKDKGASEVLDMGHDENESEMALKIQNAKECLTLLIPNLTLDDLEFIDEAMIAAYAERGITQDNESLWDPENPGRYREMPILGDVYRQLMKNPQSVPVAKKLKTYVDGSVPLFNGHTNVEWDNLFSVLDLSTVSNALKPAAMFACFDVVYGKIKEDRTKKKLVIIDEAWEIIGSKSTAAAANQVLEMAKIVRGYGAGLIVATQDVNDFFALEDGRYGKGIINACNTKIILKLEKKEADTVQELLDLSNDEYKKIRFFERGHALLSMSDNNVPIQIRASKMENDLITTDRAELEKIAKQLQKN